MKTFCVGLTGGIGSGKTTVANLFALYGVPIIDSDAIAHSITKPDGLIYESVVEHFGQKILNPDFSIHRRKLRQIIFENPKEKQWLENLLHPTIRQIMRNKISKMTSPYCICVIPLLAEASGIDFLDRILVVDSPLELRIERTKRRDLASAEDIQKVISSQADQATRLKMADDVIINDADIAALEQQVNALNEHYLQLAK